MATSFLEALQSGQFDNAEDKQFAQQAQAYHAQKAQAPAMDPRWNMLNSQQMGAVHALVATGIPESLALARMTGQPTQQDMAMAQAAMAQHQQQLGQGHYGRAMPKAELPADVYPQRREAPPRQEEAPRHTQKLQAGADKGPSQERLQQTSADKAQERINAGETGILRRAEPGREMTAPMPRSTGYVPAYTGADQTAQADEYRKAQPAFSLPEIPEYRGK